LKLRAAAYPLTKALTATIVMITVAITPCGILFIITKLNAKSNKSRADTITPKTVPIRLDLISCEGVGTPAPLRSFITSPQILLYMRILFIRGYHYS
jgi:hypothetical protein